MRINGGFFILRQEIFDYLEEGEDLVMDACRRAADAGRMMSLPYDGFWAPMDTLKERATSRTSTSPAQPVGAVARPRPARGRRAGARHRQLGVPELTGRRHA